MRTRLHAHGTRGGHDDIYAPPPHNYGAETRIVLVGLLTGT